MTSLEAIQLQRANEQVEMLGSAAVRVYCHYGCGSWWYRERRTGPGRHRLFLNQSHRYREMNRRRRGR